MGLSVSVRARGFAAQRSRSAVTDVTRVWGFIGLLAASSAAVWLLVFHTVDNQVLLGGAPVLPWWGLAIAFYLAEALVVHLHFRKQAHTLSPSEIPLILGLFLVAPTGLLAAQLLGAGLAFAIHRRQRPIKIAFNLVQQTLCTGLAVLMFHAFAGAATGAWTMSAWAAALLAAGTAHAAGVLLVSAVISVAEGRFRAPQLGKTLLITVIGALATACIGLSAVELLQHDPVALAILAAPAVICGMTFRNYLVQREQREQIEFLYESMRVTQGQPELGLAVGELLRAARRMLRAEHAEIILVTATPGEVLRSSSTSAGEVLMQPGPLTEPIARVLAEVSASERAILRPREGKTEQEYPLITSLGLQDGIVGALRGEQRVLGILIVGGRVGDVTTFSRNDLRLFETFAGHASILLENGRLEQSLAQLTDLKEKLRYQAFHDALTGLPNRLLFAERVAEALAGADHDSERHAVLFLDLDRFKMVNDSWGHATGDELLARVGERIRLNLETSDMAARLGGDEFAVLLENTDAQGAELTAERLTAALEKPFYLSGREVNVRASVGIAVSGADATTAEEILRNADIAMYTAKDDEQRRHAFYEPSLHYRLRRRRELVRELELAVEREQFDAHFQPVVSLADRGLHAFEVLARWKHPVRGLLSASEFIGPAEEAGLIREIAAQVHERAFRLAGEWDDEFPSARDLGLWVNLSPRELADERLITDLSAALRRTGFDPSRLTLEITESSVIQDHPSALRVMHGLRELGVHLSIDDFGTGYSAISLLTEFPIEMLKVPKQLVDRLALRRPDTRVVDPILRLAESLDFATVGEGIEHSSQARVLHALGCRYGQGYLFSPPLAGEDVPRFIGAGRRTSSRLRALAV